MWHERAASSFKVIAIPPAAAWTYCFERNRLRWHPTGAMSEKFGGARRVRSIRWAIIVQNLPQVGECGQGIFSLSRLAVLLAVPTLLCGCAVADVMQSGRPISLGGLRGRWAGPVTPIGQGCGSATTGLATIGGGEFSFDPFQGITVIKGQIADDGALTGTAGRSAGAQPNLSITFKGALADDPAQGESIQGTLVSGRCQWAVTLRRS
jgi:hypothetical protein